MLLPLQVGHLFSVPGNCLISSNSIDYSESCGQFFILKSAYLLQTKSLRIDVRTYIWKYMVMITIYKVSFAMVNINILIKVYVTCDAVHHFIS